LASSLDSVIRFAMSQPKAIATEKTVRDSRTGQAVIVHGFGALKGHLTIKKGVDLTKPIAAQALKNSGKRRPIAKTVKH
jgi:hypothetical protein